MLLPYLNILFLETRETALVPTIFFRAENSCDHPGSISEMSPHYEV